MLKIGVVGYSGQKFDEDVARAALNELFDIASEDHPDVTIIAGLADVGSPVLLTAAGEHSLSTTFAQYTPFAVDGMIIIESMERGSESPTFLEECDVVIRVGGGDQAHTEVAQFKEMGHLVYEYDLPALTD